VIYFDNNFMLIGLHFERNSTLKRQYWRVRLYLPVEPALSLFVATVVSQSSPTSFSRIKALSKLFLGLLASSHVYSVQLRSN
jgi:hypothetical protein